MESAYVALVRGWVDVEGYGAPRGMRGIVRSCARELEEAFKREGVEYEYVANFLTAHTAFTVACGQTPVANATRALEIARQLGAGKKVRS